MDLQKIKNIVEAALLAATRPLSINELDEIFALPENHQPRPSRDEIRQALDALQTEYAGRAIELKQVASGFRIQVGQGYEPWVARLWQEKPPRYSRALLETLAIIAYRQPITRGEIEEIRGVSVSANITRTLQEREWVKVVGHRDVPGKPALFGTTREFLDYFNLKSLDELPTLAELKDLDSLYPELDLEGERAVAAAADEQPSVAPPAEEEKLTVIEGEEGETLH